MISYLKKKTEKERKTTGNGLCKENLRRPGNHASKEIDTYQNEQFPPQLFMTSPMLYNSSKTAL